MAFSFQFEKTLIVLNQFLVKQLTDFDCIVHEYSCSFQQNPEQGDEQRAIASVCYKLGVPAIRLGNKIITQEPVSSDRLRSNDWELKLINKRTLNCANLVERKGIESLERKKTRATTKKGSGIKLPLRRLLKVG